MVKLRAAYLDVLREIANAGCAWRLPVSGEYAMIRDLAYGWHH